MRSWLTTLAGLAGLASSTLGVFLFDARAGFVALGASLVAVDWLLGEGDG